jgi:AAA+ ATPase superfamily predicted ATPase
MVFITGRRRIGKTALIKKAYQDGPFVYFFVSRKNEALLCAEFSAEIQNKLAENIIGSLNTFQDIFSYIMRLSRQKSFTLVIDEFQEFLGINPSIYSDMQHIWDDNKNDSHLNLILCGSIYSLMHRIFEGAREPLFGRATMRLHVKAFDALTLHHIMADNAAQYDNNDLLALYLLTGGIPYYVENFIDAGAFSLDAMLDIYFSPNSLFLDEGRNMLIEEFGRDYGNYFSLLALIASSKTSRSDIESIMQMPVGGYLDHLENDYNLISRVRPLLAKPGSRNVKYHINDNFLNFWFRFVYQNRGAVEIGNFTYIRKIIARDYDTYSGLILERYFRSKLAAEGNFSLIGPWWEKGNQNEIDIVALNEAEKYALIGEVKRQKAKISLNVLQAKAKKLLAELPGWKVEYKAFSIEDM